MKVRDLDGALHTINLGSYVSIDEKRPRSQLHLLARQCLRQVYPTLVFTEEVPIKITRNKTLFLDFYIPLLQIAIEVQGEQHYKFIPYYHTNPGDFMTQKKNDVVKVQWCELNNINLIILPYFEDKDQWLNRLTSTQD